MSIVIKGCVNVGHTYTGTNGNFEYDIEDLGITKNEWLNMDKQEREAFLDGVLDSEISNTLDVGIWVEGEEDWVR